MWYEYAMRQTDNPMSKKVYRFKEETLDEHVIPITLGDVSTLSGFFDALITEVRHNLVAEKLDPMEIPDNIHKELNALVMSATLDVSRVSVHNLSNLARQRNFSAEYTNRVLTVSVPISIYNVKMFADYKINAGYVVISEGRIMGQVRDLSLFVTSSFNFNEKKLEFGEFAIPTCNISVSFQGEGLSKYLLNVLTPIIIMSFKGIIVSIIQATVSKEITNGMVTANRIIAEIALEREKQREEEQRKLEKAQGALDAATSTKVK